jgi:hypothetical protein
LAYRQGRHWVDVRSSDINDFVKELSGGEFTAKDAIEVAVLDLLEDTPEPALEVRRPSQVG